MRQWRTVRPGGHVFPVADNNPQSSASAKRLQRTVSLLQEKRSRVSGWWLDAQKVSSCAGSLPPSPLHVQIQIDIIFERESSRDPRE